MDSQDIFHGPMQNKCTNCEGTGRVKKTSTTTNENDGASTGSSSTSTRCEKCGGDGTYGGGIKCDACQGVGTITSTNQGGTATKEDDSGKHTAGEIIDEAGSFIDIGKQNANDKIKQDDLKTLSDTLYNILLVVGIIAAIIVGLIMGIKFILGSLEEKAEIKAMIIPYIIGCVVVFGAFTIWQIVVDVLQSM